MHVLDFTTEPSCEPRTSKMRVPQEKLVIVDLDPAPSELTFLAPQYGQAVLSFVLQSDVISVSHRLGDGLVDAVPELRICMELILSLQNLHRQSLQMRVR